MTAPHSHAAAPTETAEVAHDGPGAVDSRGLPFTDGLARPTGRHSFTPEPDVAPAPQATGLIHIAGKYLAAPDAKTAPCHVCGKQQPVVLTLLDGAPYAICPARDFTDCLGRGSAERRAVTELLEAPAPAPEESAAAPAVKKAPANRKRPVRPSQVREAVPGEAQAETAETTEDAPEGGAA